MIRIALADDHTMFREGLVSLLSDGGDITVVAQASNGRELLEHLREKTVDVLILDIEMPKMDGFDTIRQLRKNSIETKILVLSMHSTPQFIRNIYKAGAHGYLPKDVGKKTLLEAIEEVYHKGKYHSKETMEIVMNDLKENQGTSGISEREKEIIKLIADGMTTNEIAEKLFLSRHTVESHRKNILLKLGLKNSTGLVKYAIHTGLIYE